MSNADPPSFPGQQHAEGPDEISPEEKLLRMIFGEPLEPSESPSYDRDDFRGAAVIRVETAGSPTVGEMVDLLNDLRRAYFALNSVLEHPRYWRTDLPPAMRASFSPLDRDLVIRAVSMESPGFWEFMGTLNPLKVIADYIQQRHERQKDTAYRNRLEEEQWALENASRANKVIAERIEILKAAGWSEADIQKIIVDNIAQPLMTIGRHVETRLVQGAEVREVKVRRRR